MDDKYLESSTFPYYFPEVMRENPDYKVLIDLASMAFGKLESEVDDFNSLIDPDTCPVTFLPLLGGLLGYNYRYDIKPEFNREIIKNILSVYAMRGTDRALILAATYGDCAGYIGGEVFVPGTKPDRVEAYLEFPRDHIFRHALSSYSNSDRRTDNNLYREGVIEVVVERFNDQIRDRTESVKPAGYVLRFKHLVWINPEDSNHVVLNPDIFLDIMFMVNSRIYVTNSLWSRGGSRGNDFKYSGDRFNNHDILRMIDLHQVDGRRYFTEFDNPVWLYYQPDLSLFDRPTDLQLPAETGQSSTDHCVTACKVIYGYTENSSYDNDMTVHLIESFSHKYVVTEVEVTIFRGPETPDDPDQPDIPPVDPDNPNPPTPPDQPEDPDTPVDPEEPDSKSHFRSDGGSYSDDFKHGGNSIYAVMDPDKKSHIRDEGGSYSEDFKHGGNPTEENNK